MAIKLQQLARIFLLMGAIGFLGIDPVCSQQEVSLVTQDAQREPTTAPTTEEIIRVTGVQLNKTETGIELILQTPIGAAELLQPNNVSSGKNFIVEITGAQLQLPDSEAFRQANPIEGISEVTVTNIDANTIRITATGEIALPTVELFDSDQGLIFGFTPPPPQSKGGDSRGYWGTERADNCANNRRNYSSDWGATQ
ncbi:MAG: AMIN domain-containing protein [Oscillatoriales cyanobacterium RU_3_3]|nr:AMIN domain-containing protein [Oscillatoriales cyanobacterium RU_3_3]